MKRWDAVVIEEAARLYIQEGLTLAQVSARTGVPLRTLEEWSRKYGWVSKRKRFLLQNEELEALVHKLAMRLVKAALEEEPDPQRIYAISRAYALLKPDARERLREIEKLERETAAESAEERMRKLIEFLKGDGINFERRAEREAGDGTEGR